MSLINEATLENYCLEYFRSIGYQTAYGPDILPDGSIPLREDVRQPFLPQAVRDALAHLNPTLPPSVLDEAYTLLTQPSEPSLIARNETIYHYLTDGIKVNYKNAAGEDTAALVQIIDFAHPENNDFLAVNQFALQGRVNLRRPDIVVFINGLPLSVIELKNPANEKTDTTAAYNQIQTYKTDIPDLFDYNLACIISDGIVARVGSVSASEERYMPWRSIHGEKRDNATETEAEVLVKGFFDKSQLLDYLKYFVVFEKDAGKTIKKIAGYHQFFAGRKTVERVLHALQTNSRQGGVIWHTTGSGKSLSMVCVAHKIMKTPAMQNPTIVLITDRNDLDTQLFGTFSRCAPELSPVAANSREELQALLKNKPSGGVIFTTMQKFLPARGEDTFPVLSERHNIVVISDEAHRTQYGFSADFRGGRLKYGYAKYLRDALPNACFLGFTGTPVSESDRDTQAVFGPYVDVYDMQDAIRDGATVPIFYEARHIQLNTRDALLRHFDEEVNKLSADMSDVEKAQVRWMTVEKLAGLPERLKVLAGDIIRHFEKRLQLADGKGMIVCMSRDIAVRLYEEIIKIRPQWHSTDPHAGVIKVIMTGSASDPQNYQPHLYNDIVQKEIENRMKDPQDPLKLVIVCDMWLTGFDVPCLHTMYIDKPIRAHNLIQAISRVNRVFKGKSAGLVVDYIGIARSLEEAVRDYTHGGGKGDVAADIRRAYEQLQAYMDVCRQFLKGFDYTEFKTNAYELIPGAWDHVLAHAPNKETAQNDFSDNVLAAQKAYGLCQSLPEAAALTEELAFFSLIRTAMNKKPGDDKPNRKQLSELIGALVAQAVATDKPIDIFTQVGLERPNLSLVDEKFLDKIRQMKQKDLAAELLRRLVEGEIHSRFRLNLPQFKKFSEKLKETVNKYNNGALETYQVIEALIDLAKQTNAAARQGEELGLSEKELAFYNALEENEASVRELGDKTLKLIAQELTNYLRGSVKVDWSKRESVKAGILLQVKRILRKYNYPPDQQPAAIERVLEQAELISDELVK